MATRLLTRLEGISITTICVIFALAGGWMFWQIHPLLAMGLAAILVWMMVIYHGKVCITCPHANCPANPRFWNREALKDSAGERKAAEKVVP